MSESAPDPPRPPVKGLGEAFILYLICLALFLSVGLISQRIWFLPGLVFTLLVIILLPAVVFVRIHGLPIRAGLRLNRISGTVLLLSVATGIGTWGVAAILHQLISGLIGSEPSTGGATDFGGFLLLLGTMAVLPGICEECLFRGALQGWLERRGRWFGILVAAAMFGMLHLDPWRILPATFIGVVFGWLTIRTGSILPAMIAHIANNTTAFSVDYVIGNEFPIWLLFGIVFVFAVTAFHRVTALPPDPTYRNPLAMIPSRVSPAVSRAAGGVVIVAGIVIAGILVLFVTLVTTATMNDDALEPDITEGDYLVLIRQGSFVFDINQGDTISFKRGNEIVSREVIRLDGNFVIVRESDRSVPVSFDDVIGKVIQVIPRGPGVQ